MFKLLGFFSPSNPKPILTYLRFDLALLKDKINQNTKIKITRKVITTSLNDRKNGSYSSKKFTV